MDSWGFATYREDMSDIDSQILEEFLKESRDLIDPMITLLESIEGDFSQVKKLEDYGNHVDRIMGGAKSLALMTHADHALNLVSDYAALCKAVSYKASQIKDSAQFYDVCVALLLDATETLSSLLNKLDVPASTLRKGLSNTFLERLQWVSQKFSEGTSATVGSKSDLNQADIDSLMKKLGL